jgi:hypothetical protein
VTPAPGGSGRQRQPRQFLYTHRGGKWATFYSPEACATQLTFFDRYLRDRDVTAPPRVRLEVRERRDVIAGVREENSWPLDRTEWTPLHLTAAGLATAPPSAAGRISFGARSHGACWEWRSQPTPRSPGRWPCGSGCKRTALTTFTCSPVWRNVTEERTSRSRVPTGTAATASPPAGRTLALATQPAHRAIPRRLPEKPKRPMHPALGPAAPGPSPGPHHPLTRTPGVPGRARAAS